MSSCNPSPPSSNNGGSPAAHTSQDCNVPCRSVTIAAPRGSNASSNNLAAAWKTAPCHHFDFQVVVSGAPGAYVVQIQGSVDHPSCYTPKWTLEAAAGTLASNTSTQPTHTAPSNAGVGMLRLTAVKNGAQAPCREDRQIKVFEDHLARDRENFPAGTSCQGPWQFSRSGVTITVALTWNCFGSVDHAYNGSGLGYVGSVNIPMGWARTTYDVPISAGDWAAINASLSRGDVVSFWSGASGVFSAQHAHTCFSGTGMFGANNEPVVRAAPDHPATWRWYETTSETYFNNVNAAPRTAGLLTRVIVHKKP